MRLTRASASAVTGDVRGARVHLAFLFSYFYFSFLFTPFLLLTRTIPRWLPATREQRSLIVCLTHMDWWRTAEHTQKSAHTHPHTLLNDSNWNSKCWVSSSESRKKVLKLGSPEHPKTLLLTFIVCFTLCARVWVCVCVCVCVYKPFIYIFLFFYAQCVLALLHVYDTIGCKICTRRVLYCLRVRECLPEDHGIHGGWQRGLITENQTQPSSRSVKLCTCNI